MNRKHLSKSFAIALAAILAIAAFASIAAAPAGKGGPLVNAGPPQSADLWAAATLDQTTIITGSFTPDAEQPIILTFYDGNPPTDQLPGFESCAAHGEAIGQAALGAQTPQLSSGPNKATFAVSIGSLPPGSAIVATPSKLSGDFGTVLDCQVVGDSSGLFKMSSLYLDVIHVANSEQLSQSAANSLASKLEAAIKQEADGNVNPAVNQLGAFKDELNALGGNGGVGFIAQWSLEGSADQIIIDLGGNPVGSPAIPGDPLPRPDNPGALAAGNITDFRSPGGGYFIDRRTGERFTPRGNNLTTYPYHTMLDPGTFDPDYIESTFARMNLAGYNIIRTWINVQPGGIGATDGSGISMAYMNNIYTLLDLADRYNIYVLFTTDWMPWVEPYNSIFGDAGPDFEGTNAQYLTAGGHAANAAFWGDLVALAKEAPHAERIFGYEIRNEYFFSTIEAPFTPDDSGSPRTVTTADGHTYTLDNPGAILFMEVSNSLRFFDQVTSAIKAQDPYAMVSAGLITPTSYHYGKQPIAAQLIVAAPFDFLDLHVYPHEYFNTHAEYVADFGLDFTVPDVPIMWGEFGAKRDRYSYTYFTWPGYFDDLDAARDLVDWQVESCDVGVDGWLTWAWDSGDTPDDAIRIFYTAIADILQGDSPGVWVGPVGTSPDPSVLYLGDVGLMLSPRFRPDPCDPEGVISATPGG